MLPSKLRTLWSFSICWTHSRLFRNTFWHIRQGKPPGNLCRCSCSVCSALVSKTSKQTCEGHLNWMKYFICYRIDNIYRARKFHFPIECFERFGKSKLASFAVLSNFIRIFVECITKLAPFPHHHNGAQFYRHFSQQFSAFLHFGDLKRNFPILY